MRLKAFAPLGALLLVGCGLRQAQLQKSMDTWVGHPIAEYALRFGPPLTSFDMGVGRRAFQWQTVGQTAGVAIPINGIMVYRPPEQTSCMISFVASSHAPGTPTLADWTIEQWSYQGSC